MLKRVNRDQVRLGMYIHGLEGSWMSHPFWRRRFLLTNPDDVLALHASDVHGVIIDESKGDSLEPPLADVSSEPRPAQRTAKPALHRLPHLPLKAVMAARPDPAVAERERATKVAQRSLKTMRGVFDGVRLGRAIRSAEVLSVVDEISASVARDRSALIGITRMKSKDEYTYMHSVAVCALMVNLARELGLDDAIVRDLGMAGLLHDIGKMEVPDALLNKAGRLSDAEFDVVRRHTVQGHELLSNGARVPAAALDICLHHHERMDGTGYPFGLSGDALSLHARMGAICDVYDALTSNRAYKAAWQPAQAVAAMHGWEGHFDSPLLFKFFRSIGVFPPGMLVRLLSNQLAVVLDNGRRASRPRVRIFYAVADWDFVPVRDVTLREGTGETAISEENPVHWGFDGWDDLRNLIVATPPGAPVVPMQSAAGALAPR
jgi:putative nucleotidyltransferase with HDIG domain